MPSLCTIHTLDRILYSIPLRRVTMDSEYIHRINDIIIHRLDSPAIICDNGTEFYIINGKVHREDGPACIFANGSVAWYINGCEYTMKEFINYCTLTAEDKTALILKYGDVQ